MTNNRYLDALLKLILLSAFTHLGILAVQFVRTGDAEILNYFNILDVDLFFPAIAVGPFSQVVSVLTIVGLYLVIVLFFTKPKRQP